MITFAELKKVSIAELNKELAASKKLLFTVAYEIKTKQSKALHMVKSYRRYIARIKTLLRKSLDATEKKVHNTAATKETKAEKEVKAGTSK